jgi:hypothetical protein
MSSLATRELVPLDVTSENKFLQPKTVAMTGAISSLLIVVAAYFGSAGESAVHPNDSSPRIKSYSPRPPNLISQQNYFSKENNYINVNPAYRLEQSGYCPTCRASERCLLRMSRFERRNSDFVRLGDSCTSRTTAFQSLLLTERLKLFVHTERMETNC